MEQGTEHTVGLDQWPAERWAVVDHVAVPADPADQGTVLRLLELGFVPGERVRLVRTARHERSPLAVRLGHTTFALRRHEAAFIRVSPAE